MAAREVTEHIPTVVVVMGVAGSGKTTIGALLAQKLSAVFVDADEFHSAANKEKMAAGVALTDADRAPWLAAMHEQIDRWVSSGKRHILACSALKAQYRRQLGSNDNDVRFVYLRVNKETARRRLTNRHHHYMKSEMVDSQFQILEEPSPKEAIVVNAAEPPQQLADQIVALLAGVN